MNDQPLPPRFREKSFRLYEQVIARIVSIWPQTCVFDPRKEYALSPVTFANRLRDAMTSHVKHAWPSAYVSVEKLRNLWPGQIIVSERDDGTVLTGSKESLKEVVVHKSSTMTALTADSWELDWAADEAECLATIELCHRRRLLGVIIYIKNLNATKAEYLESRYDISFSPTPGRENTYTLT